MQLSGTAKHGTARRSICPDVLTDRPARTRQRGLGAGRGGGGGWPHPPREGLQDPAQPQTPLPGWPTSCSTSLEPAVGTPGRTPAVVGRLGASTDPGTSSPLLPQGHALLFPPQQTTEPQNHRIITVGRDLSEHQVQPSTHHHQPC